MWKMAIRDLRGILNLYNNKNGLIMIVVVIFLGITNKGNGLFSYFLLMGGIISIAFTEMESRDKIHISILSSPCKRSDYVLGKFLSTIIWIVAITIIGLLLNNLIYMIYPAENLKLPISIVKGSISYILIFVALYHCVYFSLGIKFARIFYFIIFFVIMAGILTIGGFLKGEPLPSWLSSIERFLVLFQSNTVASNIILVMLVLAVLALIATISVVIYEKKDF
ncbi:ABC-2 transporter permease [uncultured Clostridium sp.]|uniref:ABC-2 transporter permease n=1 Tax=uncultured Clostridium sp. TaxID=59620 RepID=UPI003217C1F8